MRKPLLDGAVRSFRVVCCIYTIADFSISRNVFFTKCSFAGTKCRKSLPESKKLEVYASGEALSVEIPAEELQELTTVGAVIDYLKNKGVEE